MRLGFLVAAQPGRAAFRYPFSSPDAVWLARLIAAAPRGRRRSMVWKAFDRFAASAAIGGSAPGWPRSTGTFHGFLRRALPALPQTPWAQLPPRARSLAAAAVTGRLPNASGSGVRVVADHTARYAAAGRPAPSGWYGESEAWEVAPPATGDATADSAPPDVAQGAGAEPAAGNGATEPAAAAPALATSDGNVLTVPPELLQALLAALERAQSQGTDEPLTTFDTNVSAPFAGRRRFRRRWPPWLRARLRRRFGTAFAPGLSPGLRTGRSALRRARPIVQRIRRIARTARRIGALRSRTTGRRFPVFGGRVGGRPFRIVTRPRGRMRFEIMDIRSGELEQELTV